MNKSSLSIIAKILSDKRGLSQADAEKFIKQMFSVANDALHADKQVKMRWLGTFKVQSVKDRESVDVNTGERIVIEGRDKIAFTPDNILKEIVNKPFAQFETVVVNDGVLVILMRSLLAWKAVLRKKMILFHLSQRNVQRRMLL